MTKHIVEEARPGRPYGVIKTISDYGATFTAEVVIDPPWAKHGTSDEAAAIRAWIEHDLGFQHNVAALTDFGVNRDLIRRVDEETHRAVTRAWEHGRMQTRVHEEILIQSLMAEVETLRDCLEALRGSVLDVASSTSPRRFIIKRLLELASEPD